MNYFLNRKGAVILIFSLLVFALFSSKKIIIYNEELLVVLTFFGFIYFIYTYFSNVITESLDARSKEATINLQTFLELKKAYLNTAIEEQKKQLEISQVLKDMGKFSHNEMLLTAQYQNNLLLETKPNFVKSKLNNLASSIQLNDQKLNQFVALSLLGGVVEKYVSSKNTLRLELHQEAVNQLKSL
jgi:hypothetical protein